MGSGTTAVAAEIEGRDWVGIEISPEYAGYSRRADREGAGRTAYRRGAAGAFRVLNYTVEGDARAVLRDIPDDSFHCCITSPPYWGLRDYGVEGQVGLEGTLAEYISTLVAVFEEVRRVLRPDGTLWLNIGDGYSGSRCGPAGNWKRR